ncbi:MAG: MFS transporter [Roseburia sp.]
MNKDYWLYWTASSLCMAASNILQYILSLYVLDITGSATLFASMLSIIVIPRLFLTPFAGVIVDRIKKIKLMSNILIFEAVTLIVYFVLGQAVEIGIVLIYLLVIILEMGEVFYSCASSAILPELVSREELKTAIAVSKIDDGIVVVVSPMVAALIYENLNLTMAFGIVAILNLISCILQKCMRPKYRVEKEENVEKKSFYEEFKEGICCIRQDKFLRVYVKVLPIIDAFFGATFSVSVMYLLRESFQLSTYAYGLYGTVTASMSMIIPFFAVPIVKKYAPQKVFVVASALIAVEIFGIGILAFLGCSGHVPVMTAVIAITILDCLTIAEAIPMQMSASVLLQTGVKQEVLGRVSSTISMATTAGVALGEFVFGILNDITCVWAPIFLGAFGVGIASFLYWRSNEKRES